MTVEDIPLRIVGTWSLEDIQKRRTEVAGKIGSLQDFLDVLDRAIAEKQAAASTE